jgi:RNA polymerase sigma-70 factor (ECF subfamily)
MEVTAPAELAEDLASEVFARAFARRDQFDPSRGTLEAWLDTIALNMVSDTWRHLRVMDRRSCRIPVARAADEDVALEEAVARLDVRAALKTLPPSERTVIELAANDDAPVAALAEHFGCSLHMARKRMFAAVSALRAPTLNTPARR